MPYRAHGVRDLRVRALSWLASALLAGVVLLSTAPGAASHDAFVSWFTLEPRVVGVSQPGSVILVVVVPSGVAAVR